MQLLFLRSQLVDIEFAVRGAADFGDVELGFDAGFGSWFDARCSGRSGGFGLRIAGGRARGRRRRFGSDAAHGFGDFVFKRASGAGLQRHGRKAGKNFESGGERRGGGLRAKHRGKSIGGLAAGAGRYDVVDGLLEFVTGALNALQIVAESASNGLFDDIWFRCHTLYWGRFARCSPVLPLWSAGGGASTGRGRGCD
jgi:hypothetical protein